MRSDKLIAGLAIGAFSLGYGFQKKTSAQVPRTNPPAVNTIPIQQQPGFKIYDAAAAASDRRLARIFGGSGAVAAGNCWEPDGMSGVRGIGRYRGTFNGVPGHLENRMHLYGNSDGTAYTDVFLPDGFVYLGRIDPENAGHVFYYKKLGALRNVTLEVFHLKDFAIRRKVKNDAGSIRVGTIGGEGGASLDSKPNSIRPYSPYIHSHFALRKGHGHSGGLIPLPQAFPND